MSETEYERSMRQVGKDARDTADKAANAANDMSQRVGDAAAEAGAAVREATRKVTSAASDMGQQVLQHGQRVSKGVVEQVESQPVTSVLVAAAAGFVAGMLLARR
jgi:ElaB/YqjD/DUF883 family membrane-anchored ribosome-binding protein